MGKHLPTKAHNAELNKLMESDVTLLTGTAVNKNAVAVLKKKGNEGVMVAC
jgi:hypothetical protein